MATETTYKCWSRHWDETTKINKSCWQKKKLADPGAFLTEDQRK